MNLVLFFSSLRKDVHTDSTYIRVGSVTVCMEPKPFENEQTFLTHEQNGTLDEFHASYEDAVETVRSELGGFRPLVIGGEGVETGDSFTVMSPGDADVVVGEFAAGDAETVDRAVEAAHTAFDDWRSTEPERRARLFREAAALARDRKYELAATLTLENGKNRAEAIAEVDEGIDFLRFYSRELERNDGYVFDTGQPTPEEDCENRLEPYGVFGVVGPFNFPFAIFTGMTVGAAIMENAVVAKPASATPLIAHKVVEILSEAGVPDGVVNLVTGSGGNVGQPLVENDGVSGVAFTGSREVGRSIRRKFFELGKEGPVVAELGGKNSVIVTDSADTESAVTGVKKGAFSYSGQKCSATSRVYVHDAVFDGFVRRLVEEAEEIPVVPPEDDDAFVSPLIDDSAVERYREICRTAREDGNVRTGGEVVDVSGVDGRYVRPTVVTDVPHGHALAREEHFLPFVTVHPVPDLDEAIEKSNDSRYGLCAGLFTEDKAEVSEWLDRIESGMCYVNRHQSATTGALVQAQPFGGWKESATTGKFAGGYHYLPQFGREQSTTVVGDLGE